MEIHKVKRLHKMRVTYFFRAARLRRIGMLVAWGALQCISSQAAIAPSSTAGDNGELFVSVFDANVRISYTLDLGIRMNDFFVSAQQDAGVQRFWTLDDANFGNFLTLVSANSLRWAVMAIDNFGSPTVAGDQRLFTTASAASNSTSPTLNLITNLQFSNAIGAAQAGAFLKDVNNTGTHGGADPTYESINGSSVNAATDPGVAYFGESGGTGPSLNNPGGISFRNDNPVGTSSWFYYVTRATGSGTNNNSRVIVDEFDNGRVSPNNGNDGYFGLVYVDPALYPTSPYLGKYLLSYTLQPIRFFAQVSFAAAIGRTEFDGSFAVSRLSGVAAASAETSAANSITRLPGLADVGSALPALTAVPEPSSWVLMGAGLVSLLAARRRRR